MDIEDLRVKREINYSMEKVREVYSTSSKNISRSVTPQDSGHLMKHAVSSYELKKNYMDGFRDKNVCGKIKKSSYKNG